MNLRFLAGKIPVKRKKIGLRVTRYYAKIQLLAYGRFGFKS